MAIAGHRPEGERTRSARHALVAVVLLSLVASGLLFAAGGRAALVAWLSSLVAGATAHPGLLMLGYVVLSAISQILILPSGSLLLLAGGAVLGAPAALAGYFLMQVAMAPLLLEWSRAALDGADSAHRGSLVERHVPRTWRPVVENLRDEGVLTTLTLRLMPVIPNAVACMIAAALGISTARFMAGTLIGGWIRPLVFASAGAALPMLTSLAEPGRALTLTSVLPVIVALAAAATLLAVRLWLRSRASPTPSGRE